MQERVKQIGGTLGISSNGKGASVLVVLPLTEEAVSSDGSKTHNPEENCTTVMGKQRNSIET
jgi:hypothetical protein